MDPQLAMGLRTPSPRKLRLASDRMAEGMPMVMVMIRVGMQLGSRWRRMIRRSPPPSTLQERTYSFSLSWSTVPRISRAVRDHSRNLTDQQFKAIRDLGGVVGINFCTMFLADVEMGRRDVTPEQLMAHILHFLDLGGEDCVALGSDFDGATLPAFMDGAHSLGELRDVMLAAGLGEALTDKICFQNALDFWKRYKKTAL